MIDSKLAKELIKSKLIKSGYGTFARRFDDIKFHVADRYHGRFVGTGCMFPETAEIVVNPGWFDDKNITDQACFGVTIPDRLWEQLSVLVRHELLHFLLMHEIRLKDHLEEVDPDFEKNYRKASVQELANIAMDYDISNEGYDEQDKKVVRFMQVNGRIIGGLIAEDDHPEWGVMSMEDMFDILNKERSKYVDKNIGDEDSTDKPELTIEEDTSNSEEYVNMYNAIIAKYNNRQISDQELMDLIADLEQGKDIVI